MEGLIFSSASSLTKKPRPQYCEKPSTLRPGCGVLIVLLSISMRHCLSHPATTSYIVPAAVSHSEVPQRLTKRERQFSLSPVSISRWMPSLTAYRNPSTAPKNQQSEEALNTPSRFGLMRDSFMKRKRKRQILTQAAVPAWAPPRVVFYSLKFPGELLFRFWQKTWLA